MNRSALFFVLILWNVTISMGQSLQPSMYQLSTENGLPDMQIYRVVEDQDHFLWFATNSGTYKYDGKNYKLYRHDKQKGRSTFGVVLDSEGNLWYNNAYGQIFTIVEDEVILQHEFDRKPLSFVENINVIDRMIYVNSNNELLVFEAKNYSKTFYNYKYDLHPATDVLESEQGLIMLKGNFLLSIGGNKEFIELKDLTHLKLQKSRGYLIREAGLTLMMLPDVSRNNFYDLQTFENLKSTFLEIQNTTINYYKKIDESHWFLTSDGAFKYMYRDGKFILVEHYLENFTLTDVIIDYCDNIIFSTLNSGLFVIPDNDLKVLSFDSTFSMRSIHSLTIGNRGEIYFITDKNTLHKFNTATNEGISVSIPRHQNQLLYYDSQLSRLLLFNKSEGSIWDKDLNKIKVFRGVESPKDFKRLDDNRYFAAFYNRLEILDGDLQPLNSLPLRSTHIIKTNKDKILFSSSDGLQITDPTFEKTTPIYRDERKISSSKLISMPDSGTVWALANDSIYKIENDKVIDGLSMWNASENGAVQDLSIYNDMLYAATSDGLFKYDLTSQTPFKYANSIINNTKKITDLKAVENRLWFTDGVKLYTVNSDFENTLNNKTVDLYIKNIRLNGEEVVGDHLKASTSSILRVDLWVNRFNSSDRYRYFYKLDNDKEWQSLPDKTNSIVINGFESGKRTLFVQAEDIYTNEESAIKKVILEVESPYYIQWWFYVLLLLCVSGIIVLIFSIIDNYKKHKWQRKLSLVQNEKKMAQLQLENLRSQMNPHFLFNALNSLQDHIISNEKKEASKFLVKFSRLVRMYLEHSQHSKITLKQEVDALTLYLFLENKRFNGQLKSCIEIDPSLNQLTTLVPSLFIQPYIENALLHGLLHKEGLMELSVSFKLSEQLLTCEIIDNGIGRKEAAMINDQKNHKPFATRANSSRVELINAQESSNMSVLITDLTNDKDKILGTKVTITLKHETKLINN
jgi:hypothetical protein